MAASIEDKIVAITNDVNAFFDNAGNADRQQWLNEYRTAHNDKSINNFSFGADDILRENIPASVVGCSGRADLFAKYAMEKYGILDGHQIVAVRAPQRGWYLIDPGRGRITFDRMRIAGPDNIGITDMIGKTRKYNAERVYRIADILSPTRHAQINTLEKLGAIYKQVEPDYEKQPGKFKAGTKILFNKIINFVFLQSKQNDV